MRAGENVTRKRTHTLWEPRVDDDEQRSGAWWANIYEIVLNADVAWDDATTSSSLNLHYFYFLIPTRSRSMKRR